MNIKSANSLQNHLADTPIYDITAFSTLDYPDHLAAILWFAGCNMRCDYCYNRDIVLGKGVISNREALTFLQTRRGLLEGVVLSGGEATQYGALIDLIRDIKTLGFKIKLDTNGTNPACIASLLKEDLLDYIALDYKAPEPYYRTITHHHDFAAFNDALELLIASNTMFEVRTTFYADLLDEHALNAIIDDLHVKGYQGTYYLQPFLYDDNTIGRLEPPQKTCDTTRLSAPFPIVIRR